MRRAGPRAPSVYIIQHVGHAYALTGHGAQGATATWAGVIGRPEEFTREWGYTAVSRPREWNAPGGVDT